MNTNENTKEKNHFLFQYLRSQKVVKTEHREIKMNNSHFENGFLILSKRN